MKSNIKQLIFLTNMNKQMTSDYRTAYAHYDVSEFTLTLS
jgi:hypothetical protein